MTMQPSRVTIYEVGPRDGLQNESARLPVEAKVRLVEALAASGLSRIEVGSFVRADWIPQLADTEEVARRAIRIPGIHLSALVPNRHGLERAIASGLREVAVFMSSSEAHNQKNTNKPIARSLELFGEIVPEALRNGMTVRAYLSTVWGCPYEGAVDPMRSLQLARELRDMGCREISLGDTIGVGNPLQTRRLLDLFLGGKGSLKPLAREEVALHLHDTNGTALANALVGLEMGITTFDTAIGGLGGCPYAPGAAGNLATEDLAGMLSDMGIETGIDLDKLVDAGLLAQQLIGRKLPGRRLQAALGRRIGGEARAAAST
jgi:hydroxymethylglutaryl-CoA lyase